MKLSAQAGNEHGSGALDMLLALTLLSTGVGALLAVQAATVDGLSAGAAALRRAESERSFTADPPPECSPSATSPAVAVCRNAAGTTRSFFVGP